MWYCIAILMSFLCHYDNFNSVFVLYCYKKRQTISSRSSLPETIKLKKHTIDYEIYRALCITEFYTVMLYIRFLKKVNNQINVLNNRINC